jgi:hypothetical protein
MGRALAPVLVFFLGFEFFANLFSRAAKALYVNAALAAAREKN